MENSNPVQQPIPNTPGPVMQPSVPPPAQTASGGSKMVLWLISGLVVTILIVGAVYWYLNNQQTQSQIVKKEPPPIKTEDNLQKELDAIKVPEVDEQFAEIDKDLNSL